MALLAIRRVVAGLVAARLESEKSAELGWDLVGQRSAN